MKNQPDFNWLIRRAFFLLGLELAITGGFALVVVVAALISATGAWTGGSFNPARQPERMSRR